MRARFNRSGDGWITATVLDGRRVLRATLMNPRTGDAHLDALLAGLSAAGEAEQAATSGRTRPAVAPSMP